MFVRGSSFVIATLVILLIISPPLTGTTFGGIIPIMVFGFFFGKLMRKLQREIQENKAQMTTIAEESFSNVRTVKAFSNEAEEAIKFNQKVNQVYELGATKAWWNSLF